MNKEFFLKNIALIELNFGIEFSMDYNKFIYSVFNANDICEKQFVEAVEKLLLLTKFEYFDKYKGKTLAIADWEELLFEKNNDDLIDLLNKARYLLAFEKHKIPFEDLYYETSNWSKELNSRIKKRNDVVANKFEKQMQQNQYYDHVISSLSEKELNIFNSLGGIEALRDSLRKDKYSRNIANILKDIEDKYCQYQDFSKNKLKTKYKLLGD